MNITYGGAIGYIYMSLSGSGTDNMEGWCNTCSCQSA